MQCEAGDSFRRAGSMLIAFLIAGEYFDGARAPIRRLAQAEIAVRAMKLLPMAGSFCVCLHHFFGAAW